jgi:hypothetical protein
MDQRLNSRIIGPVESPTRAIELFLFAIGLLTVHALIDCRNLLDPHAALRVLEVEYLFGRPVEVISYKGYLLVQRLEGVA